MCLLCLYLYIGFTVQVDLALSSIFNRSQEEKKDMLLPPSDLPSPHLVPVFSLPLTRFLTISDYRQDLFLL